jgi:DNA adenine methylase
LERAARFIYLNKTCYNGLYRVNKKGIFNVPIGSYPSPKIYDESNLNAASQALRKAALLSGNFSVVLKLATAGDFVYFDPPYYTESNGFTGYAVSVSGETTFGAIDHTMLKNCAEELDRRGCRVVISNSDTRFIRDIYKNFRQEKVTARRFINCNGSGRQLVKELVITNRWR